MRIKIKNITYADIRNLRLLDDVDIVCGELPINTFSAEIKTEDSITIGQYAYLYDDNDNLYAKYWISDVAEYTADFQTITCQSDILLLDRTVLNPIMYDKEDAANLIDGLFGRVGVTVDIDTNISGMTVTGYCPEQTARERLQWICFCIGAYVRTAFLPNTRVELINSNAQALPILSDRVFYKPELTYGDTVTAVTMTAYTFTEGTPQTVDTWVTAGGQYYIQTSRKVTLTNPGIAPLTPENVIDFSTVTLINEDNIDTVAARVAAYYFKRVELTADILNNGENHSGQKVLIDTGVGWIATGYTRDLEFAFGQDAKSSITVSQADVTAAGNLIIYYTYSAEIISTRTYAFPAGYVYKIQNAYIDKSAFTSEDGGIEYTRVIYRPQNEFAEGTVLAGDDPTEDTEQCDIALKLRANILTVNIVDEVTADAEGGVIRIK